MANFEDIISDSATRLSSEENKHLRVPRNPLQHGSRTYWGWVATPIAAAAGVILGLFLPVISGKADETINLAQIPDTIRITQHVKDTIYLPQIVEKIKYVKQSTQASLSSSSVSTISNNGLEVQDPPTCTSIQCDGINYSLLVSH